LRRSFSEIVAGIEPVGRVIDVFERPASAVVHRLLDREMPFESDLSPHRPHRFGFELDKDNTPFQNTCQ